MQRQLKQLSYWFGLEKARSFQQLNLDKFILLRLIGAPPLVSALAMVSCWHTLWMETRLELMKLAGTTIKQYDQAVALLIPM